MRCNKCGEEYKDNQAFCLKCGNPIHVVPDFNLIEAELANDIGAMMNEDDDKPTVNKMDDFEPMKTVNVPVEDISMGLKMVDIRRDKFDFDNEVNFSLEKEAAPRKTPASQNKPQPRKQPVNSKKRQQEKRMNTIKNLAIMFGGVIVLALLVATLIKITSCSGLNESSRFTEQYNIAEVHYNNGDKEKAISETKAAIEEAKSNSEKLKARRLLHSVYVKFDVMDEDYIDNLLKIVAFEEATSTEYDEYKEAILAYYHSSAMYDEFNSYMEKLEKGVLTDGMKAFLPQKPASVTVEDTKHYNEFLKVELTAGEGCKIYYTTDGTDPKASGSEAFEYIEPINVEAEGTYEIKAYAVDANGIKSELYKVKFIIEDVEVSGPVVTPNSGAKDDYEMIEVVVPEGSKVYYTCYVDNGIDENVSTDIEDPTATSKQYTEPIEIPYGDSEFRFVIVDAEGNLSNVTTRTYTFTLEYKVFRSDAKTKVKDKCIEEKALDEEGKTEEGVQYSFEYKEMAVIDNKMCYVIEVKAEGVEGAEYYSVNAYSAELNKLSVTDNGYEMTEEAE